MRGFPLDSSAIFKNYERKSLIMPDREAAPFAKWLQEHPDTLIISCDRGGAYAEGAKVGACRKDYKFATFDA